MSELIADGEEPRTKPRPRRLAKYVKVEPSVWAKALELAEGDRKRLVIRSATEVSVTNPRS
ncbi:MAG: hypothetical protein J2P43_01245 [Candidatus Dormibacteraeota bacterium]|nr:hypothetical protein [Candidatus Dormibacteraeota bacterium]